MLFNDFIVSNHVSCFIYDMIIYKEIYLNYIIVG